MGRFESREAITGRTISDPRARRKPRGAWRWWAARRIAALALALSALAALAWFGPRLRRPPPPPVVSPEAVQVELFADKVRPSIKGVASAFEATAPAPRRRANRAAAAAPEPAAEAPGYEILSAEELDAISQAR
ncbi:MAG: hypothetical protein AB7P07_09785 [Hyphomonadaceae bacterium]